MDKKDEKIEVQLNAGESEDLRTGQSLYEMDKSNPGWQIIKRWLEDMAYHSWVDPRECNNKEEWDWRELNSFHASNNAKEILERIANAVSRGDYLEKVKSGEIQKKTMAVR